MKSIGIITYHHYYNYGTMLQAFALQRKVELLGYASELIDFKQNNTPTTLQLLGIRIKRLPAYIKEHKKYSTLAASKERFSERNQAYERFYQKFLKVGKTKYTTSNELKTNPPQYDGYVVGSDQTWNPYVANNPEAFYLSFVVDDRKKGSYAPSLAVSQLTEEQKVMFRKRLKGFRFLSCRESAGAKLLEETLGRQVTNVIDPTLLLDRNEWENVSSDEKIDKPYILMYFLGDVKEHRDFVHKLAKQTGLKVVAIPVSYLDIIDPTAEKHWVGPDKFLSLIKNAEYVCTDSFHGTMFSINFRVKFFSFCKTKDAEKSSENSRLYSALELFGLSSRLVSSQNEEKLLRELPNIDYDSVQRALNQERKRASEYLSEMLTEITE